MTREEYDALMKRKEAVEFELERFSLHICKVLEGVGYHNDGQASISQIIDGTAHISYLERAAHASCCGDDWESAEIPAHWLFGGDWKAERVAGVAAVEKAEKDRLEAEEKAEREAQEARDKVEFERLKAKFDSPTA